MFVRLRKTPLLAVVGLAAACSRSEAPPSPSRADTAAPAAAARARILPVLCRHDNYAYLVHVASSRQAIVVDPSELECVKQALAREQLALAAILNTHHHSDHTDGNVGLVAAFPSADVIVGDADRARVPTATRGISDGAEVVLAGVSVRAISTPGHTHGSTVFQVDDAIFTGDTLFVAGCGRVFEGTSAEMLASLERLAALPTATKVYPSHDYALQDATFALTVEPENDALKKLAATAARANAASEPVLPTTIGEELAYNPFLRVRHESFRSRYGSDDPVQVFAALRKEKNEFR